MKSNHPQTHSVHANDYLSELDLESLCIGSRPGRLVSAQVSILEEALCYQRGRCFSPGGFLQTVKTGEAAVRGTMEPVSKSKSIRVCVMVLTLLVEEPVPIWRC